jgi:hypothetical protein
MKKLTDRIEASTSPLARLADALLERVLLKQSAQAVTNCGLVAQRPTCLSNYHIYCGQFGEQATLYTYQCRSSTTGYTWQEFRTTRLGRCCPFG